MNNYDVIVVGAGASGLMAALLLSRAGHKVTVLEANNYVGGRIHTVHDKSFTAPVELGAEFIHGNLPVTFELLQESGLKAIETGGSFWNVSNGKLNKGYGFMKGWDLLEKQLTELKEDISLDEFLTKYFSGDDFISLRNSVRGFAEGYDAADVKRFSTFAFREEWLDENDDAQYRVTGGYDALINYMAEQCKKAQAEINLSEEVKEVKWRKDGVEVITKVKSYSAKKVVITVSAGILQDEKKGILFAPAITQKLKDFKSIGFGNAMKVILQFDEIVWQNDDCIKRFGKEIKKLGFIISDAPIPTWWTQAPENHAMLVGWCGGGRANKFNNNSEEEILQIAIDSLAYIFNVEAQYLKGKLKDHYVINWANQPYTKGGYTYITVEEAKVKAALSEPVENTIFFAGEAFYDGPNMGTVEAALASGKRAAERILK